MLLTCTLDGVGRSLWFAVADSAVMLLVRRPNNRNLPPEVTALAGRTVSLDELCGLVPLRSGSYAFTSCTSPAEMRCDVDGWTILVMLPLTLGSRGLRPAQKQLAGWVARNLA